MTVTYDIDLKQNMVFTNVCDVVDGAQVYGHQDRLRVDPDFQPDMCELMDCMGVKDIKLSTIVMPRFVNSSPWGKSAKRAIAVPNPRVFAMLRFFQVFMRVKHGNISIFHDVQSAKEWLIH